MQRNTNQIQEPFPEKLIIEENKTSTYIKKEKLYIFEQLQNTNCLNTVTDI